MRGVAFLILFSGQLLAPLWGGTVATSLSADPPASALLAFAPLTGDGNNAWKRTHDEIAGERRDLGQRFSVQEAGQTLDKLVLHLSTIGEAIGEGAGGAPFTVRLVRFVPPSSVEPAAEPVLAASGTLPEVLVPGHYLVLDLPDVELEARVQYGFEIAFDAPEPGRTVNLSATGKAEYPQGRLYFHTNLPEAGKMEYRLKGGNLVFYLVLRPGTHYFQ